jgi:flavin-dependent dehydrogenase
LQYDVVIIGAGPAGLLAAKEIAERSNLKILIVDQGRDVTERVCPATMYKSCNIGVAVNFLSAYRIAKTTI